MPDTRERLPWEKKEKMKWSTLNTISIHLWRMFITLSILVSFSDSEWAWWYAILAAIMWLLAWVTPSEEDAP